MLSLTGEYSLRALFIIVFADILKYTTEERECGIISEQRDILRTIQIYISQQNLGELSAIELTDDLQTFLHNLVSHSFKY